MLLHLDCQSAAGFLESSLGSMTGASILPRRETSQDLRASYPEQPIGGIALGGALVKQLKMDEAIQVYEQRREKGVTKDFETLLYNNLAWAYLLKYDPSSKARAP